MIDELDESTKVISILGNDYTIKAPPDRQRALEQASQLLNRTLNETKRQYPALLGDRLLVLAALNLCSKMLEQQSEHAEAMARCQAQIDATVDSITKALDSRD